VRNRFLPLKEANWKPETVKVKRLLLQKDLIDSFDHMPMESSDRFTLQVHLNKLAKTRSKDRVLQMRAYVRDIFAEAVEQDFLVKDPARKVTVASQLRDTDKSWNSGTATDALSRLSLRDRILLELDMTNVLRPSELFALRWKCFNQAKSKVYVFETAYKGAIRPRGKPRRVWDACTCRRTWRTICGSGSRSVQTRGLKPSFFRMPRRIHGHRQLPPAGAAQIGEGPRTAEADLPSDPAHIATLAQKKGAVKDVQGPLRHSPATTTTNVYMQEIPESVRGTVNAIMLNSVKPEETHAG